MISFKQLSHALAVQKTLHFKKAAALNNVSQSALSISLNELEKQLGLQIFERDSKKVLITPVGQQVLTQARDIMLRVRDLQHLADCQRAPLTFPLTLGVIPTICPFLLPRAMPIVKRRHPQSRLTIVEDQSKALVDGVRSGEIDAAILALPYPCEGLLSMEFWQEDFYWVVLKGERYAEQDEISAKELNHCKLMLLNEGHCLKEHILEVCKLSEQLSSRGFGATSLHTLIHMVLGGLGTTLIPEMALCQLIDRRKELAAIHLNESSPHRRIAFVVRPNFTRMSSIEALIDVCKVALMPNA